MKGHLLALDQGTSSSRALVFRPDGGLAALAQVEFAQFYPQPGWVEHDAEEIWASTLDMARRAITEAGIDGSQVAAIGITNQRETSVVWDRATGQPVHPAIVWQDRRTASECEGMREAGHETLITQRTGLLLDPYFSASKLSWMLRELPGLAARAARGELAFGTIDSWLIWKLTGGRVHVTDATNASRTMLLDIEQCVWSDALCDLFGVPVEMLPEVVDSSGVVGETDAELFGTSIPIAGIAGDQQAALFGQACLQPGMSKSTYGTGCFAMTQTGTELVRSEHRLLTTIASRLDGVTRYAVEGSIFVAGAAVKWLRDQVQLISDAAETQAAASRIGGDTAGVYLVPAFAGLGAPWWDAQAKGTLVGMSLDSGRDEIITATLQSVAFQTRDLMDAMAADGARPDALRVDGGMVVNDWLCQFLADVLEVPIERPRVTETTALGAAFLAGLGSGIFSGTDEVASAWQLERRFEPAMDAARREDLLGGWRDAVARTRSQGR